MSDVLSLYFEKIIGKSVKNELEISKQEQER